MAFISNSAVRSFEPSDTLNFGKYKNKSIREIALADPEYLEWLIAEIPDFFIIPENVLNLRLLNPRFEINPGIYSAYMRKKAIFELMLISEHGALDGREWSRLTRTPKSAKYKSYFGKREHHASEVSFPTLYLESKENEYMWCQLGVSDDGCPEIQVFSYINAELRRRKEHSEAAMLVAGGINNREMDVVLSSRTTMDDPNFGLVANCMIKHKLLSLKKKKTDDENT